MKYTRRLPLSLLIYAFFLILFSVYSYSLVDLNLTFVNHPLWERFREAIIQIGYFRRPLSTAIYVGFILTLFIFQLIAVRKQYFALRLACVIAVCTLLSYPFLSHDFFNYLFDARILTFYHKNPYIYKALDFPYDPYIRFMHWTHRSYPYGPVWLVVSAIPSFLGWDKFIITFLLFKLLFGSLYVWSVYLLEKLNKHAALFFATSPLVIVEGLISSHNDMLGVFLGVLMLYFLTRKKRYLGLFACIGSVLVKYITIFTIFFVLPFKKNVQVILGIAAAVSLIVYAMIKNDTYPWYVLNLFISLPFMSKKMMFVLMTISCALLFSYIPFLLFGEWSMRAIVTRQYIFIFSVTIGVCIYFLERYLSKRKFLIK